MFAHTHHEAAVGHLKSVLSLTPSRLDHWWLSGVSTELSGVCSSPSGTHTHSPMSNTLLYHFSVAADVAAACISHSVVVVDMLVPRSSFLP